MRILIIAPHYFPYNNPRALRWTAIAESFVEAGHEVHVLTSKSGERNAILNKRGVFIHRCAFNSIKEILQYFKGGKPDSFQQSKDPKNSAQKSFFQKFVYQLNDKIWKKVFFPDDACLWYFFAKKTAKKLLKAHNFNGMISVSLPFTGHLIGEACKKEFLSVKWLADIGDPFSFQDLHPINNYFLYNKWNRNLEQRILKSADNVCVTNIGLKNLYQDQFNNETINSKIKVISPLLQKEESKDDGMKRKSFQNGQGKIRLGYFGRFFKKIREPEDFLTLLNIAIKRYPQPSNQLEIHFFGEGFEQFVSTFNGFPKLKNRLFFHGLIPREKVGAAMQEMDFLINIGNATAFQLPSKSVDYLVSGKPIINFCAIRNDTFKAFFYDYPLIINLLASEENWQEENIRRFVSFLWETKNKQVNPEYLAQKMLNFSEKAISEAYLDLLKRE